MDFQSDFNDEMFDTEGQAQLAFNQNKTPINVHEREDTRSEDDIENHRVSMTLGAFERLCKSN